MLLELNISNFALISTLKIEFHKGLNILTGETGAGKSIIIDALGLVLGLRANRENIRQGQDRMIVEALFQIYPENKKRVSTLLEENGIGMEEDNTLIMTREVLSTGKNTCRINGRMMPLSIMKEVSQLLIDIHGQHEHQSLLHWETHINMLDSYGGIEVEHLVKDARFYFSRYKAGQRSLNELVKNEMELEREKDLLKFQLDEINQGKLQDISEEEVLEERRNLVIHSEKLFQNSSLAYELLYSGKDMQNSIYDQLSKTLHYIESISSIDTSMEGVLQQLNNALILVEDAGFIVRDYNENIEFHPTELDQIEKRLNVIINLKRKYGENIKEILQYKEELELRVSKIENRSQEIDKLKIEIEEHWQSYLKIASALSNLRKKIASKLEINIIRELQNLGMTKVQFKVEIQTLEKHAGYNGIDRTEFLISPNLGQDLRPLAKIASGGEVARIMLALKSILANVDNIDSLIFDEIDTGISGRTAQIVAEKMAQLSRSYQIICITHLPQIASMADAHYLIEKDMSGDQTITNVTILHYNEKIEELARMLGGATLTELTLNHAMEMIDMAEKIKDKM